MEDDKLLEKRGVCGVRAIGRSYLLLIVESSVRLMKWWVFFVPQMIKTYESIINN